MTRGARFGKPAFENVRLPEFVTERRFLTSRECQDLVDAARRTGYLRSASPHLERRVGISFVSPNASSQLFERIFALARARNVWGIRVSGIYDDMRVQRYSRGDYTASHSDFDYSNRDYSKLTVVVPLVRLSQFEGGELQIGNTLRSPRLNIGDAVVFPSFSPHRVTRVTRGSRVSLSAWLWGPPPR
jgi:PKHD-type hydroxylase